jgi:hypothetical protein
MFVSAQSSATVAVADGEGGWYGAAHHCLRTDQWHEVVPRRHQRQDHHQTASR